MKNIPESNDLKNLKTSPEAFTILKEENQRSHVFRDPRDFTYKFIKFRCENGNKIFNHVEVDEEFFEINPDQNGIKDVINLLESNSCWEIDIVGRRMIVLECDLCGKSSKKIKS